MPDLDAINRKAWSDPATVRQYRRLSGWTDPGEEAAVRHVKVHVQGQPILDIAHDFTLQPGVPLVRAEASCRDGHTALELRQEELRADGPPA